MPPRKTIDELPLKAAPESTDLIILQDAGVTNKTTIGALLDLPPTPLTAHIIDPVGAHTASAVSIAPIPGLTAIEVQAALAEINAASGLIGDGDYSDVAVSGSGTIMTLENIPGPAVLSAAATEAVAKAGTVTNELITPFTLQRKIPIHVPQALTSAAIQTAATAAAVLREKLFVPAGDYVMTSTLNLVSHSYALIEPGARLLMNPGAGVTAILAQGTEGAPVALGVDASRGEVQVTLPVGHGIVVNDMIGFISDEIVIPNFPGIRAREIHQVVAVVGNDVFLDEPLWWDYQVAESGEFWKITPVVDVHIEGNPTMVYAAPPGDFRGIVLSRALRATVEATSVDGPGIFVGDSIGVTVEAYIDGDPIYATPPWGYAMSDAGSGHSNHFKGRARNCRHGFTTLPIEGGGFTWAGPYRPLIEVDAWGGEASFAPLDTHAGVVRARFKSCSGYGTTQASTPGLQDRGYQTSIEGGDFSGGESAVVFVGGSVGGKLSGARVSTRPQSTDVAIGLFGDDITVTDCDVEALVGYGFDTSGSGHIVRGNRIRALVPLRDNSAAPMLVEENHIDMDIALYAFDSAQNTYRNNFYHGGVSAEVIFNNAAGARLEDNWHAPVEIPWAAAITPNPCFLNTLQFPVNGNTTIANPAAGNKINGARLRLIMTWNATGGWSITYGSDFDIQSTLDTSPGAINTVEFVWNGTKWVETSSSTRRQDLFGTAPVIGMKVGEYWAPPAIHGLVATGAGLLYTKRIYAPVDTPIDRIGGAVTTAVAGSTITLGYYEDDGNGEPGVPLFDAGTIDGNSATAQEKVIAQTLRGGRYYHEAALVQGGGPTMRFDIGTGGVGHYGAHATLAAATGTTLVNQGRFRSGVVGTALPNPAATTTILSAMPTITIRRA